MKLDVTKGRIAYKWIALSNTTLGIFMAMLDGSIVEISLPAIFHGIGVNPLARGETDYLLWMLMGYLVITATLLVTFGRISDMFGRVRMYNLGFVIFSIGSILLSLTWSKGPAGAIELIVFRIVQALGGQVVWDAKTQRVGEQALMGVHHATFVAEESFPVGDEVLQIADLRPIDGRIVDLVQDALGDGKPDFAQS